jgi:hypothetical protein
VDTKLRNSLHLSRSAENSKASERMPRKESTMISPTTAVQKAWTRTAHVLAFAIVILLPVNANAQESDSTSAADNPAAIAATERARTVPIHIAYFKPHDARGLNVFEAPKEERVPYDGHVLQWGAAFTQQFQMLDHDNSATPNVVSGVDQNSLIHIGSGFNNADANLYLDAQLARGIRVALTSYLSSKHHSETWVKDGYLLIDGSPWENEKLDALMKHLTLRLGHFEINYGDMHFRRTDNGQAMFNPFVGNLLMDAFTTEIGGEVYFRKDAFLAMAGMTGGEVRGQVVKPEQRSPSYTGKLGFDRQMSPNVRVRLTGSIYQTTESISNTLYSGNRSGSRYNYVVENPLATENAQAWSGDVRPGFSNKVTAWVVNPFVKCHGLEVFGNIEQADGRNATETSRRKWDHYAGEAIYRLFGNQIYVGGRYNVAKGKLAGIDPEVTVSRVQVGGGWFLTQTLLAKAEYIVQKYEDFPVTDIRHGAKFEGTVIEAVVAF